MTPNETIVRNLIEAIGEDSTREGLAETPRRVVGTWAKIYAGYLQNPAQILSKQFIVDCDEMVLLRDIEFYSTCEHHMLPFFGRAHVGYIPTEKVVGISKLARLVECFARRLQVQERLTAQVADSIMEHLAPKGCAVMFEAQHFCMTARGVEKQNSVMVTSALRGLFKDQEDTRKEFLSCVHTAHR
jgi:GTP cyclohydrolase I